MYSVLQEHRLLMLLTSLLASYYSKLNVWYFLFGLSSEKANIAIDLFFRKTAFNCLARCQRSGRSPLQSWRLLRPHWNALAGPVFYSMFLWGFSRTFSAILSETLLHKPLLQRSCNVLFAHSATCISVWSLICDQSCTTISFMCSMSSCVRIYLMLRQLIGVTRRRCAATWSSVRAPQTTSLGSLLANSTLLRCARPHSHECTACALLHSLRSSQSHHWVHSVLSFCAATHTDEQMLRTPQASHWSTLPTWHEHPRARSSFIAAY